MRMIDIMVLLLTISFWLLFLGRTAMLARQGVKVFVIARGKRLTEKLIEIMLVPLLVLWTVQIVSTSLGDPVFRLNTFWDSPALQWFGLLLCLCGILIFLAALISFGNAWRVGVDEQNSDRLVTTGVFAYSRNPIFVFMNMYFGGIFMIYPSTFFLVFFMCFSVGIHFQILNEERFLKSKFGATYMDYCNKVRRYI